MGKGVLLTKKTLHNKNIFITIERINMALKKLSEENYNTQFINIRSGIRSINIQCCEILFSSPF